MNFEIILGSLNIVQNRLYAENRIMIKTPHGTHCAAGQTVNSIDTSCPDQTTRAAGITSTFIDTSTYCESDLFVCSDSSSSCPAAGTAIGSNQGDFSITLDDGPVQFTIDSSPTPSSSTYLPKFDTFAVTSQNKLRENAQDFSGDKNDPRMYIYELSSPSFSHTWIHLFLKQYLQARVWLISILSLNFLTPNAHKYSLIHIPNATCPSAASGSLVSSTYISNKLKELSFVEAKHVVAELTEDDYYSYDITEDNKFDREAISFLDRNVFIILCLIMMVVATLFLVILVFWMVVHLKTFLEKRYQRVLHQARVFSRAKQGHLNDPYGLASVENPEHLFKVPTKVLRIGCFTTEIVEKDEIEENYYDKTFRKGIEKEQMIQLSFFKALSLEIDSYFRKRRNSFKDFLSSIKVDEEYFRTMKEKYPEDTRSVSIRFDFLLSRYLDFCTRHGLKERIITEEEALLEDFDLKIQSIESSTTSAYTKIRWKTFFEKEKHDLTKEIQGTNVNNARRNFIIFNCVASRLESDYILQEDLEERYRKYCDENKIDPVMAGSILTCQELNDFGAIYREDFKVPHIVGITKVAADFKMSMNNSGITSQAQHLPRLIRTEEPYSLLFGIPICGRRNSRMSSANSSRASFGRSLFQLLFFLTFLFGAPFLLLLLTIWSLQQVNMIKSDIYAPTFGLSDVFEASSTENWLDHLEFYWILYLFLFLGLLFTITGLAELI